jgi:hypothetical protein
MGRSPMAKKAALRDAASKVAEQRPSVLKLARELGNVAEACWQRGMDRKLLRVEAPVPDAGLRRAEGPAADPQEPPAANSAGDRREDQGAGPAASGLQLQPPRGDAGAVGYSRFVDHDPEDPPRPRARYEDRPLARVRGKEC